MIQRLRDYVQPYHRPHDRWVEVETILLDSDGQSRVVKQRRRSLRSWRQIFTVSTTAFVMGVLLIVGASPYSNEFFAPGALSSSHAQILAGQGTDRCAACHDAGNQSMLGWVASGLGFQTHREHAATQSELCMKCHNQSFAEATALNPHNETPARLTQRTAAQHQRAKQSAASFQQVKTAGLLGGIGAPAFGPPVNDHEIACSACHREHHGNQESLTALTNAQCQSCHQNSFHSFAQGHPEFTSFPLQDSSSIAFDHGTHFNQHFPAKSASFNCSQCHLDDATKTVKLLAPFEQSCAQCHEDQILESGQAGWDLIALPMLDTDAIEAAKLKIGSWPLAATGDFDGVIPAAMKTMLNADSKARAVLERFGDQFEFSDLDAGNPQDVKDAVTLVWAIKRLLLELATEGPFAIGARLEAATGRPVSEAELKNLALNLDASVFQNSVRRWLPNLTQELAGQVAVVPLGDRNPGSSLRLELSQDEFESMKQALLEPGAAEPEVILNRAATSTHDALHRLRSDEPIRWPADSLLANRAGIELNANLENMAKEDDELLAENPLAGLLGPSTSDGTGFEPGETAKAKMPQVRKMPQVPKVPQVQTRSNDKPTSAFADSNVPRQATPRDAQVAEPGPLKLRNLATDAAQAELDPELLAINPLQSGNGSSGISLNQSAGTGLTAGPAGRNQALEARVPDVLDTDSTRAATRRTIDRNEFAEPERPLLVRPAGWFRDDTTFKISYRASGHADRLIHAWTDWAVKFQPPIGAGVDNASLATAALRKQLIDSNAAGMCRSCHTASPAKTELTEAIRLSELVAGSSSVLRRTTTINWTTNYRQRDNAAFTKFKHGPHLIQPHLQDCSHCHQLNPDALIQPSIATAGVANQNADLAYGQRSNFLPIEKSNCATCHQPTQAGDSCTQCHSYHQPLK